MKHTRRRLAAGVSGLAVAATAILATTSGAAAAAPPGWETDPNAIGTITFYNASGAVITGGNLSDKPLAAYAVASHAAEHSGDTHAQLYAYTPQVGTNPQTWSGDDLSASIFSPAPAGAPSAVRASGNPFVVGGSGDLSLSSYIGEYPNTLTTAGYQDLYELRLYTTGPTAPSPDPTEYDRADISVNPTAGTWSQITVTANKPVLSGSVAITGSVKVASTVKCKATFDSATTVAYLWKAGGSTVSKAQSFKIPASAYDKKLTCTASGSNASGTTTKTSAAKSVAKGSALKAKTKPKIVGTATTGKKLKAAHGTWSPAATKYSYQWTLDGKKIKGATKSTFTLPSKDIGGKVGLTVTAKRAGYASGVAKTKTLTVKN